MLKITTCVRHSINSHPFGSKSISHPIPVVHLFQNLTLKIQGQCHWWGEYLKSQHGSFILSTHILFTPCQSAIQSLRYNFFKIWPWKSKANVMGEVNVESHNNSPAFRRLTSLSFYVNLPSHPWDTTFSKFDLENPRAWSWLRSKWKSQNGCNILSIHIFFVPCQSALPSWDKTFSKFDLENSRSMPNDHDVAQLQV